ncbi:hypothetical protein BS627_04810 [Agrobacterium salinitolerans]|nr:hypothetical protein BS627_04810 [Agrobacterium salinitolerans]PNQ24554.1 hypothetical protein C2E26_04890 [Rhizobium sp. YIC5082]
MLVSESFAGAKMDLFQNFIVYWPFSLAGILIFFYAMILVHRKIDIGVGHSILVVAGFLIALVPFVTVKVGTDGSIELQRLKVLNEATQSTVEGVGELQKRLENLASVTEKRLDALENPKPTGTFTHTGVTSLPTIVNPPNIQIPALDDPQAILNTLQRDDWRNNRLPIH